MVWLLQLLACARVEPVEVADLGRYREALRSGACETIITASLRDDCWLSLADQGQRYSADPRSAGQQFRGSGPQIAPPPDVCDRVEDSFLRDECWFLQAEATDDFALCAKATSFYDSCRLHLLTQRFAGVPAARLGAGEEAAAAAITAAGFAMDDLRGWSTWYRWILTRQVPLDRPACATLSDPVRVDACQQIALVVYESRMRLAHDRRVWPCRGEPLPPDLAYVPDPEIDRMLRSHPEYCGG